MKISKANNNGSVCVILPKKLIEKLGWKEGDDLVISDINSKSIQLTNIDKEE